MRASEFITPLITEADLSRRRMLGYGLGAVGAAGGAGMLARMAGKSTGDTDATQSSTTQPSPSMVGRQITDPREREQFLRSRAEAAGITGSELLKFLAQCAHETRGFRAMEEEPPQGQTRTQYFVRYDPSSSNPKHREVARKLGNVQPGDGPLYHGRGFIQLTGRDNYRIVGKALGLPLVSEPELAAEIGPAADIAVWWWLNKVRPGVSRWEDNRNLNREVTRKINPGASTSELKRREQQWRDYRSRSEQN